MTSTQSDSTSDKAKAGHTLPELVRVMRRLLAPDGCPWDREQTLDSLKPYLLEETYELLDAIETGTPGDHCEELGDLMMQIVFQAELRADDFDIDDVVRGIADKLTRRHPHIFGDTGQLENSEQVLAQWSEIKEAERKQKQGDATGVDRALTGVPMAMPGLLRAQQLTGRAANVGFDWPDIAGCRDKVTEELAEVDEAMTGKDPAALEAEVGDLLLAVVNLSRKLGVDAEGALRGSCQRFTSRFEFVEDELHKDGRSVRDADLATMDELWNVAKSREK